MQDPPDPSLQGGLPTSAGAAGEPSADSGQTLAVRKLIDEAPFGAFQSRIIVICLLACVIEGFDQQALAVAGPLLLPQLGEPLGRLGPLYSIGLLSFVIGGATLGPLGDRIGRKWLLVCSLVTFGLATLVIPTLTTLTQVMIARFVTGLAFGGAAVAFIAIPVEYVPTRMRERVVALTWAGLPIGGMTASLLGNALIESHGWQILFVGGGLFPLLLAAIAAIWLPESVGFLVARGRDPATIARLLRKVSPNADLSGQRFDAPPPAPAAVPVKELFAERRTGGNLLLWFGLLLAYMIINLIVAWTPTLLNQAGAPIGLASLGLAAFNAVSLIAVFTLGYVLDRRHAHAVLAGCFVLAAVVMVAFALIPSSTAAVFAIIALIGFLIGGGATGLVAIASNYYPTAIRGTGIGWSLGFARIGSIIGPLLGTLFLALGFTIDLFFAAMALPALLIAATLILFERLQAARRRKIASLAAPAAAS